MHHLTAKIVGERLRELRTRSGLSQSRLEYASTIPKARISRYENGHVLPAIDSLDRLAGALGVTLSEFFQGVG